MSVVGEIQSAVGEPVVSNPGVRVGTPIFRGSRLPLDYRYSTARAQALLQDKEL